MQSKRTVSFDGGKEKVEREISEKKTLILEREILGKTWEDGGYFNHSS